MWRLLLGTMGVKSLVQGLNAAATAGFEPRTVWSEVRRRNRLATAPPPLSHLYLYRHVHNHLIGHATTRCNVLTHAHTEHKNNIFLDSSQHVQSFIHKYVDILKHMINTKKLLKIEKRDCAWGCARRINTAWENLQSEKHKSVRSAEQTTSWFVLFDLQIFSGGVYPPSETSRTIPFFTTARRTPWLFGWL